MDRTATRSTYWTAGRDDYGRSQHILHIAASSFAHGLTVGAVVRLPKVAIEAGMLPYLSNDWTVRGAAAVAYHQTLAEAKARLDGIAADVLAGRRPAGMALGA